MNIEESTGQQAQSTQALAEEGNKALAVFWEEAPQQAHQVASHYRQENEYGAKGKDEQGEDP